MDRLRKGGADNKRANAHQCLYKKKSEEKREVNFYARGIFHASEHFVNRRNS